MAESQNVEKPLGLPLLTGWVKTSHSRLRTFWQKLRRMRLSLWVRQYNTSQWCYFIAALLILYSFLPQVTETNYIMAGWIAFIGLTRELLHLFHRIWQTTFGKSIILVLYASTANIALAYAAMKINLITGIEPGPFVFTLGFATLVMMPFWITVSTVASFTILLIFMNLWLLARLPLKLIGLNIQLHWEDKKRALLTMILRICLIPLAIYAVVQFTLPYFAEYVDADVDPEAFISHQQEIKQTLENSDADNKKLLITLEDDKVEEEKPKETLKENEPKGLFIKRIVANFIWTFEAYPNSACFKPADSRSVYIDEFSILLVSRDPSEPVGYKYEVAECKHRYVDLSPETSETPETPK